MWSWNAPLLYSREWNRVKVALLAQADVYLGKGKTRVFRTFPASCAASVAPRIVTARETSPRAAAEARATGHRARHLLRALALSDHVGAGLVEPGPHR